ncbi:MAG: recombinase RecA [Archangiaceae bacterium]|nr:recombinase RecA [Archangiaceae bacterium]
MKHDHEPKRLSTGVPGLDTVLRGGLLRGGVYIIQGNPGAGKTVLTNQISFHHARNGGRVLYTTLLAESHERLMFNLGSLKYFDPTLVPEQITYLSGFSLLEEGGLKAMVDLVRKEARDRGATLLVIDGLVTAAEQAGTDREFKRFIHALQIHAGLVNCTVLMLTSGNPNVVRPEHTMVDGVIDLSDVRFARRNERELEVRKFRGSDYLRGAHTFNIDEGGVRVHPRVEVMLGNPSEEDPCGDRRVSTNIVRLDAILEGGLLCGSTTLVTGPSGSGKTTLGLQFLSGSKEKEPGLFFGFYETPRRLVNKARTLGLDLATQVDRGIVRFLWHPPTDRTLDALGNQLIDTVRLHGIKRVFLDGLDGFVKAAAYPERVSHFFIALGNELRQQGVTTLCSAELSQVVSPNIELPVSGLSAMAENAILLRFAEVHSELFRLMSVIKMRDSGYHPATREFRIGNGGVDISESYRSVEDIMEGRARPRIEAHDEVMQRAAPPRSSSPKRKKKK